MKKRDEIIDKSDLRKYRTELPNLLDDMGLSVYAFRLYAHIKRVAGASENGRCYQGTRTMAEACKMSVGQVSKAKRELLNANPALIEIHPGEKGQSDTIFILDIWQENFARYSGQRCSPSERGCSPDEQGCSPSERGCSPGERKKEPMKKEPWKKKPMKKKVSPNGDMSANADLSIVEEVFSHWKIVMRHPAAKLTKDRREKILARLKEGYSVEQMRMAIDGCGVSPFHMGDNDRGRIYDDLTLILRTGTKLENFMAITADRSNVGSQYE